MKKTIQLVSVLILFISPLTIHGNEGNESQEESTLMVLPFYHEDNIIEDNSEENGLGEGEEDNTVLSYPYLDEIKLAIESIKMHTESTIKEIQGEAPSTFSIIGGEDSESVTVTNDLYISKDTTLDRSIDVFFNEYSMNVMPEVFVGLNQCQDLISRLSISDETIKNQWSNIINSLPTASVDEISTLLNAVKDMIISYKVDNQEIEIDYSECLAILDYLLNLDRSIPTLTFNGIYMSAENDAINLFNGAILDIQSGSVTSETMDTDVSTINVYAHSQLINSNHELMEVISSDYNPQVMMYGKGSAIYFEDTYGVQQINHLTIQTSGAAFFKSEKDIYVSSSVLMDSQYVFPSVFNEGSGRIVFDLSDIDDSIFESSIDINQFYTVKRQFTSLNNPQSFHITQENYDSYEKMFPRKMNFVTKVIEDESYADINDDVKKLIENEVEVTAEVSSYVVSEATHSENVVILNPKSYFDYEYYGIYGFDELQIQLIYDEPIYHSKLFEAYYVKAEGFSELIVYYKQHYFIDFETYIYCETLNEEKKLESYYESDYEIYPNFAFQGESNYTLDFELHNDDIVRLKMKNSLLSPIIDIPINYSGELPSPPKPTRPGNNDTGETTGGGGRDENDRPTNEEIPFPEPETPIEEIIIPKLPIVETPSDKVKEEVVVEFVPTHPFIPNNTQQPIKEEKPKEIKNEAKKETLVNEDKKEEITSTKSPSFGDKVVESVQVFLSKVNQVIKVVYETIANTIISFFKSIFSIFG